MRYIRIETILYGSNVNVSRKRVRNRSETYVGLGFPISFSRNIQKNLRFSETAV